MSVNSKPANSWPHSGIKFANFLGVPVCKSQIRKFLSLIHISLSHKFLENIAQLCLKKVLKEVLRREIQGLKVYPVDRL
jgi:hypothetical protein